MEEKYRQQLRKLKTEGYEISAIEAKWFPVPLNSANTENARKPGQQSAFPSQIEPGSTTMKPRRNLTTWIVCFAAVFFILVVYFVINIPNGYTTVTPPATSTPAPFAKPTPPTSSSPPSKIVVTPLGNKQALRELLWGI